MNKTIKQIYRLFVMLCFTMILIDFAIINNLFIHDTHNSSIECTDHCNNIESSHSTICESEYLNNDSNIKSYMFFNNFELAPILKLSFKDNYNSFIWQPPKFS